MKIYIFKYNPTKNTEKISKVELEFHDSHDLPEYRVECVCEAHWGYYLVTKEDDVERFKKMVMRHIAVEIDKLNEKKYALEAELSDILAEVAK